MPADAPPIRLSVPVIGDAEKQAVLEVLDSGHIAEGPRVRAFEAAMMEATGARHAVACVNGTAAVHLALWAAGVGPGDDVVVPAFTFVASANAVLLAGARPVLADVDPETFTLTEAIAQDAVTPNTKAIMPVHLYGHPADVDPLRELAAARGITLVGDACQAHGATYKGRAAGNLCDLETFSFYATKNAMSAEGGMVTTNDDELADLMRSLRNHGRGEATPGTYDHLRVGHNYRMTDVLAAIGCVQLARLPEWTRARRRNAATLTKLLEGTPGIRLPVESPGVESSWHQYTVVLESEARRRALQERLRKADIGSGVYYPKALHEYEHLAPFARGPLPVSTAFAKTVLSLPIHPGLTDADLERIASVVRAAPD